jgi:outer membrane protein TolC
MAQSSYFIPISGPPSAENNYNGVFGSVGSFLLNWEAVTFGQRKSRIDLAKSYLAYSQADNDQEIFYLKVNVVNAYLDLIMAGELLKVYEKNLDRAVENSRMIKALVLNGLRPGVDTALFNTELSAAKIEFINYEGDVRTREAGLSEWIGRDKISVISDSSFFYKLPSRNADTSAVENPLIRISESKVNIGNQELIRIRRTQNPKISMWGTAYARGSGIRNAGFTSSSDGLSFSRFNYGIGITFSLPLLQFAWVHPQLEQQKSLVRAEEERLNQVRLQMDNQGQVSDVLFENKLKIAREVPFFYQSALYSWNVMLNRYNAGLTNDQDLIQAQYALIKAETDLKKSYLEAWKALLYKSAVRGDLSLFLNQIH